MGFSGDCICIKKDLSFERIDSLKVGDILFNPYDENGSKIIAIEEAYESDGFRILTNNFFEMNISKDTMIETSSIIINEEKYLLSNPEFKKPFEMNKVSFFPICGLKNRKNVDFENLYIYSKAILKGINNDGVLFINNMNDKLKNIERLIANEKKVTRIKKNVRIDFYKVPFWMDDLNKKSSQRFLNKEIFNLSDENFYRFINSFLQENTDQFLNLNNFRVYTQSKVLAMQLFFLIISYLDSFPNIELVKKDIWSYEKIKQSNKRNMFAITCKDDLTKPLENNEFFFQNLEKVENNNRNIKYIKIITEDEKPFIVYNFICKDC